MTGCFFALALLCYLIGLVLWLTEAQRTQAPRAAGRPEGNERWPARAAPPAAPPAPPRIPFSRLPAIQVGARITVRHPRRGDLTVHVDGAIEYAELMQQGRQGPWQATGNVYPGYWLEGGLFLLAWQNRLYLLDDSTQLSDADIQREFAPHARKFAQSDQTADVYFAYPPATWKIDDIGRFRVDRVAGGGLRLRHGAVGRFIHASGDGGRALVVEDYESGGGGEDTAWVGHTIAFEDVKA